MKERLIQLITAAVLSIGGLALLFLGALLAPQGEIHETILVGFGEVATFAGSIMGIDYFYKYRNHDNCNTTTKPPNGQSGDGRNHPPFRRDPAEIPDP